MNNLIEKYKILYLITVNLKGLNENIISLKYNHFKNQWVSDDGLVEITVGEDNYILGWNERVGFIWYLTPDVNAAHTVLESLKNYRDFSKNNLE